MADWTQGYVADVEYHPGFYGQLAPAHLDLVCLLNAVQPPDCADGATYCELGSGQSLTTTVLAAANPRSRFVAVDFNPAQVARARARIAAAGLDNIWVHEASFEALADDPAALPAFDYVALHGVYTWVSPDQRRAIVRFLDRKLAAGGLVYVGYNALPGWTAALPIQHLVNAFAGEARGRSDARVAAALSELHQVAEAGSVYLRDNPFLDRIRRAEDVGEHTYLAHEYLNANWQPLHHAELVADLAPAKLDFVGSGSLLQNFPQLMLTEAQRAVRERTRDPVLRETLKDYFTTRAFRADVFVRGRRDLDTRAQGEALNALPLALISPRVDVSLEMDTPVGTVTPRPQVYQPMLDALAEAPATVGALRDLPEVRAHGAPPASEVAGMLVASGHAAPAPGEDGAADGALRLNRTLAGESLAADSNRPSAFAAPRLGTGIPCATLEQNVAALVLRDGLTSSRALAEAIWAPIKARGETLVQDGTPVHGEAANLDLLEQRVRLVLERKWPLWRMLGVVPGAPTAAAPEPKVEEGAQ
jgi:SAM-dependent methyltransferase